MLSLNLIAFSLFSSLALAEEGSELFHPKWKKAPCNADNCLRAARATSASPFPFTATNDCSSFMRKTVTPCPVTTTTVTTTTITVEPTFQTVTASTDLTISTTTFETITSPVTTVTDIITFIQPTEVDVTNVIVTVITVTQAPQKRAPSPAAAARDVVNALALPQIPGVDGHIEARATSCTPTTASPSRVPTYASACSGTARYSSACSCAGITGSTTTLSTVTSTSTSVVTEFATPTVTTSITLTNSITTVLTETETIPTTIETTITTISQSPFTVTTDFIVPTTVVVSPPVCSTYNFVATNGFRAGQFLAGGRPPTQPGQVTYGFVNFTPDPSQALGFTIQADGRVYASGNGEQYYWVTNGNSLYYILEMTLEAQNFYGIRSVYCSINQGASAYPGAIGQLTCSSPLGTAISVEYCPQTSNNLAQTPGSVTPGCTLANLAVIPACN